MNKRHISSFLKTDSDFAPFIARITLGSVMLPHGLQKTFGWFGGYGFEGTIGFFTGSLGMPLIIAVMVILAESVGAIALLLGFLTRFVAASIGMVMLGAIVMAHWSNGFFMNWFGQQSGEGFEYHLLAIGLAVSIIISGGGKWSIDSKVSEKLS